MTREEAKAYIIQHCNPDYPNGSTEWETAMNMAIEALQQPKIVCCKDCKHFAGEGMYCAFNIMVYYDRFYCFYGKRKEGEADEAD